ncbi:hypothetical protein FGIG_02519 [Fasciola gigantica]|uniref:Uncharacterized protein n=1 Tax=Fasciola gigantica TaxID=46835 RepID=A0A504YZT5_FASGI|nr:hypothetical protein FGIG_02519 [Fasciola gigantica]
MLSLGHTIFVPLFVLLLCQISNGLRFDDVYESPYEAELEAVPSKRVYTQQWIMELQRIKHLKDNARRMLLGSHLRSHRPTESEN